MARRLLALVALALAVAAPADAMRRCGDHVPGRRRPVPCRCGDVLVSSRTLNRHDGVTRAPCRGGGLLVNADGLVRLDLGGHRLQGSGHDAGVFVLRGTLDLAGPGSIEGFQSGVVARGPRALASVAGVRLADNRLDGLAADADGYTLQGSVAERNGRDGFVLDGNGYAADGNRATENGRWGFDVCGMGGHLGGGLGNEATGNRMAGFYLRGMMHALVGATANANVGDGVFGDVIHTMLVGVRADGNLKSGVRLMGTANAVGDTVAVGNRGVGVSVMGAGSEDRGGNRGEGNVGIVGYGRTPSRVLGGMMAPLTQCQVGMMTVCR
jgi:hypothetical protein